MPPAYAGTQPLAAQARSPAGFLWTDYWYLAAIAIAVLVAVDPLELGLARQTLSKHLALIVAFPAVVLALLLRNAMPRAADRAAAVGPVAGPFTVAWPLAAYAAMVIAGSLCARFAFGINSTFLNYGLYVTLMFCAAAMVLQSAAPLSLLRGYFGILLAGAFVMSALLIVNARTRQVYHEEIFLVIPMAAFLYAGKGPALLRWAGAAFFLSMAWFSHKYTSYLVAALAVVYLAAFAWLPRVARDDPLARIGAAYWGALACAAALVVAAAHTLRDGAGQPTGNLDFRLHTYRAAWERFLDSPLWGSWFAREAAEKFTLYEIGISGNVLPTHSDLLDLLANGGVLALGLCAAGLAAIARLAWRRLLRPALIEQPEARYGHALALLSLAAMLTCAFNPILLQPQMAALAWSNLGMLLGLSLRAAAATDGERLRP